MKNILKSIPLLFIAGFVASCANNGDPTSNPFNDFLKEKGIWIAVGVAGAVFICVLVFFIIALVKRKKAPLLNSPKSTLSPEFFEKAEKIIKAIGGEANILEHSLNGSRIILVLADYDSIDEKTLKEMKIIMIKMSKKITLAIESDADKLYKAMFNL